MMEMEKEREMEVVRDYLSGNPPFDIVDLIKSLGINYREAALGAGNSGRIERYGDDFYITVNSEEGAQRRRFTAAHELAHYLLHRDLLKHSHADRLFGAGANENPPDPFTRQHEIQANRLAANLIMPREAVTQHYHDNPDPFLLAETFAVSPAAMEIRLKNLRLIN
jgi:Zn-dependent peptidase ImmA (M78 family)